MANIRENCSSRKSDFNRSSTQRNQTKSGRKMWKIPNDQIIFLGFATALCVSRMPYAQFAQYCIIFHMHLLIFMVILFYFCLVLDMLTHTCSVVQAPSFHHRKRRWFAYILNLVRWSNLLCEPKLPLIWLGGFDLIAFIGRDVLRDSVCRCCGAVWTTCTHVVTACEIRNM